MTGFNFRDQERVEDFEEKQSVKITKTNEKGDPNIAIKAESKSCGDNLSSNQYENMSIVS